MEINQDLLLSSAFALNILFLLFLGYRFRKLEQLLTNDQPKTVLEQITLKHHYDVEDADFLFFKKKKVVVKGQLYHGDIPLGGAIILGTRTIKKFDEEKVKNLVNEVVAHLLREGVHIGLSATGVPGGGGAGNILRKALRK
jgi:hypothetical protein